VALRRATQVLDRLSSAGTRRHVGAGLLDQVVMAAANAANTVVALALLDASRAGALLLSIGLGYLVIGLNRAFVGDVLLALASRYDGERRDRLVRNGLATALLVGVTAAVLFALIWALWPRHWQVDLRDLGWIAIFLPALLVHDTGRYSYLADRRPDRALIIDLVWVGTQTVLVLAVVLLDLPKAAGLPVAWGLGAAAGATVFLVRSGARPLRGSPRQWLAETRHLAGWFTLWGVIGQLHTQAVGFLVAGRLSREDLAGLRAAQTGLLQPMQNFITAVQGLLVPRVSRLASEVDTAESAAAAEAAAAAFRRQIRVVVLGFLGLAALAVVVAAPVAYVVLSHIQKYRFAAPIALPMSMQAGLYLIQVPFTAALRGMHRGRTLVTQYAVFALVSLTGLFVGASAGHLEGAVWGLLTGSALGLAVMIALYARAVRALRPAAPAPVPASARRAAPRPAPDAASRPAPDAALIKEEHARESP
jgi:O-antigen/teichoic acid export membrane protein